MVVGHRQTVRAEHHPGPHAHAAQGQRVHHEHSRRPRDPVSLVQASVSDLRIGLPVHADAVVGELEVLGDLLGVEHRRGSPRLGCLDGLLDLLDGEGAHPAGEDRPGQEPGHHDQPVPQSSSSPRRRCGWAPGLLERGVRPWTRARRRPVTGPVRRGQVWWRPGVCTARPGGPLWIRRNPGRWAAGVLVVVGRMHGCSHSDQTDGQRWAASRAAS